MKVVLICGVTCESRNACIEEQKNILENPVVIDETTTLEQIQQYFTDSRNVIWDQLNLYPESREQKLKFVPSGYHKTAVYVKPKKEELTSKDPVMKNMQFVAPSEFENFDCIMRYM